MRRSTGSLTRSGTIVNGLPGIPQRSGRRVPGAHVDAAPRDAGVAGRRIDAQSAPLPAQNAKQTPRSARHRRTLPHPARHLRRDQGFRLFTRPFFISNNQKDSFWLEKLKKKKIEKWIKIWLFFYLKTKKKLI